MNYVPFNTADQQIVDALHRLRPDLVTCCQRLLRIPSVNGVHDEVDVAQEIAARAQHLGLDVQRIDQHPQRPVLSISTSPRGATGLLLVGHMDTVAPGDPTSWTYPPFSGTLAGGRIYGRGAIDNKSGIAAALYALAVLAAHTDALPAGRAQLVCVPDEESGATGELGIKMLAQTGLLQGRGAIYTYAGSDILLGHRGVLRYRLTCRGEAIHTGSHRWQHQQAGANAVTGLARLLLDLVPI
jgi:acetylornithine deacetylase/succinyl-diaminopimelate desuccinylase-like protein